MHAFHVVGGDMDSDQGRHCNIDKHLVCDKSCPVCKTPIDVMARMDRKPLEEMKDLQLPECAHATAASSDAPPVMEVARLVQDPIGDAVEAPDPGREASPAVPPSGVIGEIVAVPDAAASAAATASTVAAATAEATAIGTLARAVAAQGAQTATGLPQQAAELERAVRSLQSRWLQIQDVVAGMQQMLHYIEEGQTALNAARGDAEANARGGAGGGGGAAEEGGATEAAQRTAAEPAQGTAAEPAERVETEVAPSQAEVAVVRDDADEAAPHAEDTGADTGAGAAGDAVAADAAGPVVEAEGAGASEAVTDVADAAPVSHLRQLVFAPTPGNTPAVAGVDAPAASSAESGVGIILGARAGSPAPAGQAAAGRIRGCARQEDAGGRRAPGEQAAPAASEEARPAHDSRQPRQQRWQPFTEAEKVCMAFAWRQRRAAMLVEAAARVGPAA